MGPKTPEEREKISRVPSSNYEDYISLLPDYLIHHIFSFLPTRDVVKTCILSKRWRFVWTTISDLRFSVWSYDDSFVDTVLMHYMWRKVKKFHLDVKQDHYHSNIDSWIHFAIDHQVEDFFLNLNNCGWDIWWEDYTWSPLLNHCSSLTKLCLRGCRFSSSDSLSWSSLKFLSIQNVSDDVLQKILMGSPLLEHLNLIGCRSVKRIQSRSLRELVIDACWADYPLEISTPCLLSLRVRSAYFCKSIRIIEAPSIVKAELDFGPATSDCRLLKELLFKLQNATRILFGAWCFQVMLPLKVEDVQDSLPNCKFLTLHVPIRQFNFPAIANMLATTPNLEKLVIKFELSAWDASWYNSNSDSNNVDLESYWHTKKKFKCSARHLKNVEIFGFYACVRFKYDDVFILVKFLLQYAFVLENMVINNNHKSPEDLEVIDSRKLLEVAQRLESYHRASQHAAVTLNYLEEGLGRRHNKGDRVTTKCLCVGRKNAGLE